MRQRGHSLLETTLVLGLMGLLACIGVGALNFGAPVLVMLPVEMRGALDQAFLLARARGAPVKVILAGPGGDVAPLLLPRGVRWGLPPGIEPPREKGSMVKAPLAGTAHRVIGVTPRGTATANVWFVTDGRDAVCMTVSGPGRVRVSRWRQSTRAWEEV